MFKYFKDCKCIEDVKKMYRKLCKEYHPDLHGAATEEIMKAINAEYEIAFERYRNVHETADSTADSKQTYTAHTDTTETPEEFRKIIERLITCEGLEISIVGRWIWAEGNTYPHKEILKELGFKFASKKKAWYWHREGDGCKSRKGLSMDSIKAKYGCETFTAAKNRRLAAV